MADAFWRHLGVFQVASGTLEVRLYAPTSGTSVVLADAVRLVHHENQPTTNLAMTGVSLAASGALQVQYTVSSGNASPFSIGIYASPDGVRPVTLLQTIEVDDPAKLATGGTYAAAVDAILSQLTDADYLLAKLDIYGEVYQQSRADDISAAYTGMFRQDDGTVFVVGGDSYIANGRVNVTQNATTRAVTIAVTDSGGTPLESRTFSDVSAVNISTRGGHNAITIDPGVTVPVSVYGGTGSTVTGAAANAATLWVHGPATISEGQNATLTLNAALPYGTITQWNVAWGDGTYSTVTGPSPSHQYTTGSGTYTVSVSASDSNGNTATPQTIAVAVLPGAPTLLSAAAVSGTGGQVQLSWTNNSQIATGYRVEKSSDGTNYTLVAALAGGSQTYTVTGLLASTQYYFRVCAVNDAGRSAYIQDDATTNGIPGGTVVSNDDNSSELVDLGMNLDLYGTRFSQVYVNNNGNLTTASAMSIFTPDPALATGYATHGAIIAPFFADVDSRAGHGTVSYASTTVGGRPAWTALWDNVDYYNVYGQPHANLRNTFSVTLVDRSDVAPGDFDIIFDYADLNWDTGDASGGQNGLAYVTPAYPARAGYSSGSGEAGTYYEFPGSGTAGGLLGLSGTYTCQIRNVGLGLTAHRTGGNYGAAVSAADQASGDPGNYVILVNDNFEQDESGQLDDIAYNTSQIAQAEAVNVADHDLAKITLAQLQAPAGRTLAGTVSLVLSNANSARIYDADGNLLTSFTATLGSSDYLAGLANGDLDVYVEGLQANPDFSLTYRFVDASGKEEAAAAVHMAIADLSIVGADGTELSRLIASKDLLSGLPSGGGASLSALYRSLNSSAFRTEIGGLHSGQIQQVTVTSDAGDEFQDTLTDSPWGSQSGQFCAVPDNGGEPLTPAQRAQILSDFEARPVAAPVDGGNVKVQFETPGGKDSQRRIVTIVAPPVTIQVSKPKMAAPGFGAPWIADFQLAPHLNGYIIQMVSTTWKYHMRGIAGPEPEFRGSCAVNLTKYLPNQYPDPYQTILEDRNTSLLYYEIWFVKDSKIYAQDEHTTGGNIPIAKNHDTFGPPARSFPLMRCSYVQAGEVRWIAKDELPAGGLNDFKSVPGGPARDLLMTTKLPAAWQVGTFVGCRSWGYTYDSANAPAQVPTLQKVNSLGYGDTGWIVSGDIRVVDEK